MTTVTITPGFKSMVARHLSQLRLRVAARASGVVLRETLDRTPVEDGHAHTAWLQAAIDVATNLGGEGGRTVGRAISGNLQFASGDPKAAAAGFGMVSHDSKKTEVVLRNKLDFIRAIEYGGVIMPISPGGRKVPPAAKRPGEKGELYGTREAQGRGMVFYVDAIGRPHFAPSYRQDALHPLGRAMDTAADDLRREGIKVRRQRGA